MCALGVAPAYGRYPATAASSALTATIIVLANSVKRWQTGKIKHFKMDTWLIIRGYVAGTLSFLSCPCHLPLTLPVLLAVTAGTAVGSWLANNITILIIAFTLFFVGGLLLAQRWLATDDAKVCAVEPQEKQATLLK